MVQKKVPGVFGTAQMPTKRRRKRENARVAFIARVIYSDQFGLRAGVGGAAMGSREEAG
jgi:hypothetical protein